MGTLSFLLFKFKQCLPKVLLGISGQSLGARGMSTGHSRTSLSIQIVVGMIAIAIDGLLLPCLAYTVV